MHHSLNVEMLLILEPFLWVLTCGVFNGSKLFLCFLKLIISTSCEIRPSPAVGAHGGEGVEGYLLVPSHFTTMPTIPSIGGVNFSQMTSTVLSFRALTAIAAS